LIIKVNYELSWRSVLERCFSEGNLVDFQPFLSNLKDKNRVLRKSQFLAICRRNDEGIGCRFSEKDGFLITKGRSVYSTKMAYESGFLSLAVGELWYYVAIKRLF
jgi:hypothetical protein